MYENSSMMGDNDGGSYSASKNKNSCNGYHHGELYDKLDYDMEDHPTLFDDDCLNPLHCHSGRNSYFSPSSHIY